MRRPSNTLHTYVLMNEHFENLLYEKQQIHNICNIPNYFHKANNRLLDKIK